MAGKNEWNEDDVQLQARWKLQRHTQGLVSAIHSSSGVSRLAPCTFQSQRVDIPLIYDHAWYVGSLLHSRERLFASKKDPQCLIARE